MNSLEKVQIRVFLQKPEAAARQQLTKPFIGRLTLLKEQRSEPPHVGSYRILNRPCPSPAALDFTV
jgi:hypothetical protein